MLTVVKSLYSLAQQISGGKGFFEVHDSNEPVVAICQGCTGNGSGGDIDPPISTTKPTPTTSTTDGTSEGTKSTTESTTPVTTVSTTTSLNEDCCNTVILSSEGGVLEHYHEALGEYLINSINDDGKPVYLHKTNLLAIYLHHTTDLDHNWSGWQFTRDSSDTFGFLSSEAEGRCPSGKDQTWKYHMNGQWFEDQTVTVECISDDMTTASTDKTTTEGDKPTTPKPEPGDMTRTIIFIEKVLSVLFES